MLRYLNDWPVQIVPGCWRLNKCGLMLTQPMHRMEMSRSLVTCRAASSTRLSTWRMAYKRRLVSELSSLIAWQIASQLSWSHEISSRSKLWARWRAMDASAASVIIQFMIRSSSSGAHIELALVFALLLRSLMARSCCMSLSTNDVSSMVAQLSIHRCLSLCECSSNERSNALSSHWSSVVCSGRLAMQPSNCLCSWRLS